MRLIELVYKLVWRRLGDVCLILNNCNLACILRKDSEDIRELRGNLPSWILVFTLEPSGLFPHEKVEYQKAEFINLAQSFGLTPMSVISEVKAEDVMNTLSWVSPQPYWKLRLQGGCQELFFLTTMDKVGQLVKKFYGLAGFYKYPSMNIGVYIQPMQQGTGCHCEFDLYYNPQILEEIEVAKKFFYEGARALIRAGAFFARPYGPLRDITYPYVSAPFIIIQRKIKAILDPNNIMNPGKLYFG
jgi:hypothetical protein